MMKLRSVLSLLLALVATVVVGCGDGAQSTSPATYTPEKIEQIQDAVTPVKQARKRLPELESLLEQRRWSDADSLIHGPLGGIRQEMSYVTRNLLPQDQEQARELSKALFNDLEKLDAAIDDESYSRALQNYDRAIRDFDNYLSLIPEPQPRENNNNT